MDDYLDSPAPHSFVRKVSVQALQALAYLHKQNIMHGDIHPGNILLALTYALDSKSKHDIWTENMRGNELNDSDDSFPLDDKTILSDTAPTNKVIVLVNLGAGSCPAETKRIIRTPIRFFIDRQRWWLEHQ
jgi:serine/threonine protein kinase